MRFKMVISATIIIIETKNNSKYQSAMRPWLPAKPTTYDIMFIDLSVFGSEILQTFYCSIVVLI